MLIQKDISWNCLSNHNGVADLNGDYQTTLKQHRFCGYHKTLHDSHFLVYKATLALFMSNYQYDWNTSLANQTVWLKLPVVLQFPFTCLANRIHAENLGQTCTVPMVTDPNKKPPPIISFMRTTTHLSLQIYRSKL